MPAFFEKPLSALTSTWRIFHEESMLLNPRDEKTDFEELRGYGDTRIYRHGQVELAVSSDIPRVQRRLRAIPGLRPKTGSVLLFADALLDTVAEVIRARRRRSYTPEQLAAARENAARLNAARKRTDQDERTCPKTDDLPGDENSSVWEN